MRTQGMYKKGVGSRGHDHLNRKLLFQDKATMTSVCMVGRKLEMNWKPGRGVMAAHAHKQR